jgi:hypothetical protein
MHIGRQNHTAVYHSQYLYLRECERYNYSETRWEVLPALPIACFTMRAVELDNSLYALGGIAGKEVDTVQKLNLDSLTWSSCS